MSKITEGFKVTVPQYGALEVISFCTSDDFNSFFKSSENEINVIQLNTNVDEDHIWYTVFFKRMLKDE